MKKTLKEVYDKDVRGKMHFLSNIFLTKRDVSTHEAIKRVLSVLMKHSNTDVLEQPPRGVP